MLEEDNVQENIVKDRYLLVIRAIIIKRKKKRRKEIELRICSFLTILRTDV